MISGTLKGPGKNVLLSGRLTYQNFPVSRTLTKKINLSQLSKGSVDKLESMAS